MSTLTIKRLLASRRPMDRRLNEIVGKKFQFASKNKYDMVEPSKCYYVLHVLGKTRLALWDLDLELIPAFTAEYEIVADRLSFADIELYMMMSRVRDTPTSIRLFDEAFDEISSALNHAYYDDQIAVAQVSFLPVPDDLRKLIFDFLCDDLAVPFVRYSAEEALEDLFKSAM
jgi:hypothetical protein